MRIYSFNFFIAHWQSIQVIITLMLGLHKELNGALDVGQVENTRLPLKSQEDPVRIFDARLAKELPRTIN